MSEENKRSRKKVNPELEEKIRKTIADMLEAENETDQEIDFTDSTDVSGGVNNLAWEISYKTEAQ